MQKGLFQSTKSKFVAVGATAGFLVTQAQAAVATPLVAPAFNANDAVTVGTAVLGGLALIWGIKKAMSMAK